FISMKAKAKFRGLINVSGFHVDPGYSGRLVFSVFNAGPKSLHFKRSDDLFLIWFANLDRQTEEKKNGKPLEAISSELINGISGEIQSAHSMSERLENLEKKMIHQNTLTKVMIGLFVPVVIFILKDFIL
ncbi:MAG: hypothetical protein ABW176_15500, partial [Candidatus Thiodiazotropha endolucinida]